jgi:hypothetical protein
VSTLAADLVSRFRRLVELREKRDQDKKAAERSEKAYREAEAEIWEELEESPVKGTVRIDLGDDLGVVTFQPKETYYGRVINQNDALDYFEERALMDEFTTPKIVMARVNEQVRQCIEQGDPIPPGLDYYAKRYISISKK